MPAARRRSSDRGPTPGRTRTSNGARKAASRPADDDDAAGLTPVARDLRDHLARRCRASTRAPSRRAPPPAPPRRPTAPPGRRRRPRRAGGSPRRARSARRSARPRARPPRPSARRPVARVARAEEDGLRTAAARLGAAHRRVDAEPARLVVRGRHDAAAVRVAADDERSEASSGRSSSRPPRRRRPGRGGR